MTKNNGSYTNHDAPDGPQHFSVKGRDRWALDRLIAAKTKGCTPITNPAPRWASYVFNLRKLDLEIETVTEKHGGEFSGHHARYVLHSRVTRQEPRPEGGAK